MSLALYRKYRPATFAELKGQEHVAEPLQQALRNGRVNHAYLFSGPRGCGKTSSARILARSLNCEQGPTPDPCGTCDSCVGLGASGSGHIDVIEIDAASHGGVDDARDLRERAFFAPVAARFKIYIIDEAHMVTREGFNALLKLVEEPPPHLKFIFATTEPEKVIGTIRSRTHHYPFRLMPPSVLRELLEEILRSEEVAYEPAALPLVVRAGAGSARDSLSILDQLLAGSDEAGITYARAVSLLGYTDSSLLDEVVDAFASGDGAAVFAAVDRVIESGQDPRRFAADLLERLRDLVILANVPDAGASGLLDVPPDELERMSRQVSEMGPGDLTRAADLLHTGLTEMRGATSPRLLLELICARILLPGAYDDEASVFARLDRLERRFAIGDETPPLLERTAPARTAPVRPAPAQRPPSPQRPSSPQQPPPVPADAASESPRPAGGAVRADDGGGRTDDAVRPHALPDPAESPQARPGSAEPPRAAPREEPPRQAARATAPQAAPGPRAGQPAAVPAAASAPAAGGLDIGAVRRSWADILEAVKQRSKVAWIMLDGTQPASIDRNVLTVAFAEEGKRRGFSVGGKEVIFREVLKEYLGVDWRIETVLGNGRGTGTSPGPATGPVAGSVAGQAPAAPSPAARPAAAPARWERPVETPPPPPEPPPVDESDEVDPDGDADAGADAEFSGMALIQRELGGQIIREIDNT